MEILPLRFQNWMSGHSNLRARASGPPLRAELFNVEQLAGHARALAARQRVAARRVPNNLLDRLGDNEKVLREFNVATLAVDPNRRITPAAEWLLDNFYLIDEQIQMARRHLPRGYSRELPRLVNSPDGFPRVYDIVLELISHVDAQIDVESLRAFIAAYQETASLSLGELWAIPIMLRLGLIENLQRVATRLAVARADRDLAGSWVRRLQNMVEKNPSQLVVVVADMAISDLSLSSSFVAEFCQLLSRKSPVLHLARSWLEQRLVEQGTSIEQLIQLESQNQAADQVTVSHSITSLRFLSAMDWKGFVEGLSLVEATLRGDPADVYRMMDFATRDRYRHAVEFLARHSGLAEGEIARRAIQLAAECARAKGPADRTAHVGFHLVDQGRSVLGRLANVRWPWHSIIERGIHAWPLAYYGGGIGFLTFFATLWVALSARSLDAAEWKLALFTLIFLLCASQLSVSLMNWLSLMLLKPRLLPRLDFSTGIRDDCRTMVVVPTMLGTQASIDRILETLEVHHLANRDRQLYFALLTDFRDAPEELLPADQELLLRVRAGIELLNSKYATSGPSRFFLFHRPRRWNAAEGRWMGYERKRGKLMEFNALLRGGSPASFSEIVGQTAILPEIKYVITLDTDTQLPREAARQLVGTMAHPLNRPVFDAVTGIVTAGYGILQPRVGVSLPGARRSWFVRLFAGDAGIDPYTREVSDIYQDVFQEGSFVGKGIYDVDAFERALKDRFPENTVLSHDLLEACHARSALVCDVELYEEYPSRYNVDIDRRHRWIRGDWQITQWLLRRVPGRDTLRLANPLSALSQWKIFDNLRRSLVPVALTLLLAGPWLLLPAWGGIGPLLVIAIISLPVLLSSLANVLQKSLDLPWPLHLRNVFRSCLREAAQILLTLAFLPYDAFISVDAIGRTMLRLLVTRQHLLEWQTYGESEQTLRADLPGFYGRMWIAPLAALFLGFFLAVWHPVHLFVALPFLGLWLAAPWIAWRISQPIEVPALALDPDQIAFLGQTARKTWHFFENLVTAEENWLPPDNFQEVPGPRIATRTSPTNMGLALLANLAAHDLGYLSLGGVIRRTQAALATMQRLERHRGHFYNWYETRTLAPLLPLYVSSVDSGNLAGHLLTLAAGLREQANEIIFKPQTLDGLRDTVRVLAKFHGRDAALATLEAALGTAPASLRATHALLQRAKDVAVGVTGQFANREEEPKDWSLTFRRNCEDQLEELLFLAPWLAWPGFDNSAQATALPGEMLAKLDQATTLREIVQLAESLDSSVAIPLDQPAKDPATPPAGERKQLGELARCVRQAADRARERLHTLESLAAECDQMAVMDFTFLFDPARKLFATGFNVLERRCDHSFYDLLASEARLCSYVAIALGQISQDHWFSLGRLLVASRGEPVLISWSGSMFEYLMPLLVMPNYENTLLDHTCREAVQQQIDYGKLRDVPWGISESAYNRTDAQMNYQYRAFGVPGLGLKRGLAEDLVIAPYATALALMVAPREACENLQRLAGDGRAGSYGFYEAVDYTPSHLPPDETSVTIRSYMVHHQGMSLVALTNLLREWPMQRRFMECPLLKAADLLLQERVPKSAGSVFTEDLKLEDARTFTGSGEAVMRVFTNPNGPAPDVHLLSNGRYHVAISSAGGGCSRRGELAVNRWREDGTRDCWGIFVYLRDTLTGDFWSATYQPALRTTTGYEAIFTQGRAEFRHRRGDLDIHMEISVSPEDDVELRRLTIVNRSSQSRPRRHPPHRSSLARLSQSCCPRHRK